MTKQKISTLLFIILLKILTYLKDINYSHYAGFAQKQKVLESETAYNVGKYVRLCSYFKKPLKTWTAQF